MRAPERVAVLLSFVAGYVDTVGYVALYGLFTAHVTGNLVLIGSALAQPHEGLRTKLLALPVFVAVVMVATLYVRRCERRGLSALRPLLAVQMLLLVGFAVLAGAASPIANADAPLAMLAGLSGVAAMSVQNALSRLLMAELPPTTVMTGGVTQLAIDAASLWSGGTAAVQGRQRIARFLPPVLAFASGAMLGALLYLHAGFAALAVPVLALLAVFRLAGLRA